MGGALPATMFFLVVYLQGVLGMDPLLAGLALTPGAVGIALGARGASRWLAVLGPRGSFVLGTSVSAGALVWLAGIYVEGRYAVDVLVPLTLAMAGFGAAGLPLAAGDSDPLDDAALDRLAACWHAVGEARRQSGIGLALHVDFLSALRREGALDALLQRTDPELVGLALDTGELTVAGIDPLGVVQRHGDRIRHVQFKDALAVDDAQEYRQPHAHWTVRVRGGAREVPRWFSEPGVECGLVDFPALTRALLDVDYSGWVAFESDQSPHPAASALLGGYLLQRELRPIVEREMETTRA